MVLSAATPAPAGPLPPRCQNGQSMPTANEHGRPTRADVMRTCCGWCVPEACNDLSVVWWPAAVLSVHQPDLTKSSSPVGGGSPSCLAVVCGDTHKPPPRGFSESPPLLNKRGPLAHVVSLPLSSWLGAHQRLDDSRRIRMWSRSVQRCAGLTGPPASSMCSGNRRGRAQPRACGQRTVTHAREVHERASDYDITRRLLRGMRAVLGITKYAAGLFTAGLVVTWSPRVTVKLCLTSVVVRGHVRAPRFARRSCDSALNGWISGFWA